MTTTVGPDGGEITGPGGIQLIVPQGALAQEVELRVSVRSKGPSLPDDYPVTAAGEMIEITLPSETDLQNIVELIFPLARRGSAEDDRYTVLRWDGAKWSDAGGSVEGDQIRIRVLRFSIFLPVRTRWIRRPVSFVNDGPYDATVMPWTFVRAGSSTPVLPPDVSTVSFAPGAPGLWPNPSRFLGLPLGRYTFCIHWTDDRDRDDDGYLDYYHTILTGPSPNQSYVVTANDPVEHSLAREVRFRTDPVDPLPGRCGIPPAGTWTTSLTEGFLHTSDNPPVVVAFANVEETETPANVTITSSDGLWRYHQYVAVMQKGHWIEAAYSGSDATAVGVQFVGDTNDGWVKVLVDGQEVWRGSVYGTGPAYPGGAFVNYLEVSGLEAGPHTIRVEALGIQGKGGGDDASMLFFGFGPTSVTGH
jgi:hypothetical protein